jgi:hypothetical protein
MTATQPFGSANGRVGFRKASCDGIGAGLHKEPEAVPTTAPRLKAPTGSRQRWRAPQPHRQPRNKYTHPQSAERSPSRSQPRLEDTK